MERDWDRVATIGIVCALLAVAAVMTGAVLISLSDANMKSLGHWFDGHGADIWKTVAGAAAAVATFLFGHRRGRVTGRTETEIADAAAAKGQPSGDAAAAVISEKAKQTARRA